MVDGWEITYDDGSTFSDLRGTWAQAPATGVVWAKINRCRAEHPFPLTRYTRRLIGMTHFYLRVLPGDVWEFGVWVPAHISSTGADDGERYLWAPRSVEVVHDAPQMPVWATGLVVKQASGPPWPWDRGLV